MFGVEITGKIDQTIFRRFIMPISLEEVIEEINKIDNPAGRAHPLPDNALIKKYEHLSGFTFPEEYKNFLRTVSNAFVGFMSPFTLSADSLGNTRDLLDGLNDAEKLGIPNDWLPICEDNGDYYCLTPDGSVRFWDHNGASDEKWPNLATWAKEVWLEGE